MIDAGGGIVVSKQKPPWWGGFFPTEELPVQMFFALISLAM